MRAVAVIQSFRQGPLQNGSNVLRPVEHTQHLDAVFGPAAPWR